jgi:hypothetical protein
VAYEHHDIHIERLRQPFGGEQGDGPSQEAGYAHSGRSGMLEPCADSMQALTESDRRDRIPPAELPAQHPRRILVIPELFSALME